MVEMSASDNSFSDVCRLGLGARVEDPITIQPVFCSYGSTSESLQYELESFGIRVKLIEPGAIKTDFYGRSMDRAPDSGPSVYDPLLQKVLPLMDSEGQKGASPDLVARVIYRAASDGRRKLRYGAYGQPFLALRKILPDAMFFKLVRFALMR